MFRADRNHLPRSKPRREGTSRRSISCETIATNKQSKNLIIMKSENVKNDGRERTKKGGRPVKGAAEKLKYRITVKMATEDYYLLKSKAKAAGVSASEFVRGSIMDGGVKERLSKEHGGIIRSRQRKTEEGARAADGSPKAETSEDDSAAGYGAGVPRCDVPSKPSAPQTIHSSAAAYRDLNATLGNNNTMRRDINFISRLIVGNFTVGNMHEIREKAIIIQ